MANMQIFDEASALELPFQEAGEAEDRFDALALEAMEALDERPFADNFSPYASNESSPYANGEDGADVAGVEAFLAGPNLRQGSSGPGVVVLQQALAQLGHGTGAPDGRFGPGTARALRAFQSRSGITPDGVAGPRTKAALAAAVGGSLIAPPPPPPAPRRPGSAVGGRLVVDRHPMLRAHRGTAPDLVLRWNRIDRNGDVDVVVHFHGYSAQAQAMRIDRHKESNSGLDFADPTQPGSTRRIQPTIGVLPRGNFFGGQSGSGYNFPALVRPGAVRALVQDALQRVGQETGHALRLGRLILTGHSGGGAPISAMVAETDPDEVQVFDGTYGAGDAIAAWAERRIARELDAPAATPPALRVLYRPGTQTAPQAQAIWQRVCGSLHDPRAAHLAGRFRVESTRVEHNDIPRRYGWRLLADVGADLPDTAPLGCAHGVQREAFDAYRESEQEDDREAEASPWWQAPANEQEQSEQEAISLRPQDFGDAGGYESEEPEAGFEAEDEDEDLAWLDVEAEGAGFEGAAFEDEDEALSPAETLEQEQGSVSFEMRALEQLIDAEDRAGSGLVERIKGVAGFVLGPTLRRGSAGPAVETLQRCLAQLGHAVSVDGRFGPGTERAVKAFQSGGGMTADGVCGPRTKAAIAAAVGSSVGPSPAPLPGPAPGPASALADEIARIAEAEYRRWHGNPPLHETDTAAVPILQAYYREGVKTQVSAAELQDTAWQNAHPWSAVFVSFVMRKAGAGTAFRYAPAHQDYVAAARRNRLDNVASNPFWAYRADEVAPEVGDLVCAERKNSGATYDNIGDARRRMTHCDIVTAVRPDGLRVIGGNVRQNVDAKRIRIEPDGRLALDGDQARFFAVLRCRGPIGSVAPQPRPQPQPQPQPAPLPAPPAPPAGQKLSPAQFVAAFAASARASWARHGVPSLVTLGQAALESGWGERAPRFNFFGIKAKASDPEPTRQLLRTREVLKHPNAKFPEVISVTPRADGRYDYVVRDWFRAFPDAATAFDAHGAFLSRQKRYAKAFVFAHDPYAFAAEVAKAGYATDPSYERVLKSVMRKLESVGAPASET